MNQVQEGINTKQNSVTTLASELQYFQHGDLKKMTIITLRWCSVPVLTQCLLLTIVRVWGMGPLYQFLGLSDELPF